MDAVVRRIEWTTLLFFAALFITMEVCFFFIIYKSIFYICKFLYCTFIGFREIGCNYLDWKNN